MSDTRLVMLPTAGLKGLFIGVALRAMPVTAPPAHVMPFQEPSQGLLDDQLLRLAGEPQVMSMACSAGPSPVGAANAIE